MEQQQVIQQALDEADRLGLSATAYHFIGGILAHLPGLEALTCPSVNSYRRLQPRAWSSVFVCYGPDNREAALRIPSRFWGSEMASTNLELTPSDSSANPYLALGEGDRRRVGRHRAGSATERGSVDRL